LDNLETSQEYMSRMNCIPPRNYYFVWFLQKRKGYTSRESLAK